MKLSSFMYLVAIFLTSPIFAQSAPSYEFLQNEHYEFLNLDVENLNLVELEYTEKSLSEFAMTKSALRFGYKNVITGPVYRSVNPFASYDFWRYVTYYNIEEQKERVSELPAIHENCFDNGSNFASYSNSISYQGSVNTTFKISDIGFSASFVQTKSFNLQRLLKATEGIEAIHTPFIVSEKWIGKTYLEVYNDTSKEIEVYNNPESDFYASGMNPVLKVERKIIKTCSKK